MTDEENEVQRLKEALERTREQLFQAAKLAEMGKLVAVVAHELSQPLLGIKAFAQILRRRFRDDAFIEPKVRMIEEQAVHMESILGSLRRYSKRPQIGQEAVEPIVPVRAALELFQERAKKLRIRMTLEGGDDLPRVQMNHGHLQQVVVNLLGNAIDELEESKGGLILMRLDEHNGAVRMRVTDTGGGVPEHVQDSLFEPFFTTKSNEKGTGLGLSICADILRINGGSIRFMQPDEVENSFGAGFGAAFEVTLPAVGEGEGPDSEPP